MTGLIIAIGLFAAVVFLQYMSKRPFGFAVIGLIIGSIIAGLWSEPLSSWLIGVASIEEVGLTTALVHIGLVLAPSLALIGAGKSVSSQPLRIIGAVIYGLFIALLLLGTVADVIELGSSVQSIYQQVLPMRPTIIGIVAVLATFDVIVHASSGKRPRSR